LDYGGRALIRLQNTQKSVTYRLFLKEMDGAPLPEPETWMSRELRGTDGDLDLPVTGTLTEDLIIGIIARKPGSLPEGVSLNASLIIPVRPALITKLNVLTSEDPEDKNTSIQVTGVQCGVIYQLYQQQDDKAIAVGEPVFYHRNAGIGNTRISGDYIADHYRVEDGMANWVKSEFVVGSVDIEDKKIVVLPAGVVEHTTIFYVVAKKSTTGFAVQLRDIIVTIA